MGTGVGCRGGKPLRGGRLPSDAWHQRIKGYTSYKNKLYTRPEIHSPPDTLIRVCKIVKIMGKYKRRE